MVYEMNITQRLLVDCLALFVLGQTHIACGTLFIWDITSLFSNTN